MQSIGIANGKFRCLVLRHLEANWSQFSTLMHLCIAVFVLVGSPYLPLIFIGGGGAVPLYKLK